MMCGMCRLPSPEIGRHDTSKSEQSKGIAPAVKIMRCTACTEQREDHAHVNVYDCLTCHHWRSGRKVLHRITRRRSKACTCIGDSKRQMSLTYYIKAMIQKQRCSCLEKQPCTRPSPVSRTPEVTGTWRLEFAQKLSLLVCEVSSLAHANTSTCIVSFIGEQQLRFATAGSVITAVTCHNSKRTEALQSQLRIFR